jgi:hypothetical protein
MASDDSGELIDISGVLLIEFLDYFCGIVDSIYEKSGYHDE